MNNLTSKLIPYTELEREPIQYTFCKDYPHVSRYRALRQVVHEPDNANRFTTLETSNPFTTSINCKHYEVPHDEENRLDLIAYKLLGSSTYSWVLAYFNQIPDGFTVQPGRILRYPENFTALFDKGECLAPVSALNLTLTEE